MVKTAPIHQKRVNYSDFFEHIYTTQDLQCYLKQIDKALDSIFNVKSSVNIAKIFPYSKKQNFEEVCQDKGFDIKNPLHLKKVLEGIKQGLLGLPVMKMVLAFEPVEEQVKEISRQIANNAGKRVILDIEINKKIIAGVILGYKGVYQDCSIKSLIEDKHQNYETI